MKLWITLALLAGSALWGQPVLRSTNPVVNGASYANTIAPGSIFVVFGTNLAGDAILQAPSLPLQTSLGGASIRFTPVGGGAAIDALMVYTTRNQIAGLLPSSAAAGEYDVRVTSSGQTSGPGRVRVVARSLGIVSADSSGGGQAQAQSFRTATEWDLNRYATGRLGPYTTAPARAGQVIVLWGTGLGADTQSDLSGGTSGDRTQAAGVRVIVAGIEITPAYAGRASGLPGSDQINFSLPANVPNGCSLPVQVRVGDTVSNTLTLAVATGNACPHPNLSETALRRMSEGGTVVLGELALTKLTLNISMMGLSLDTTEESASGSFSRYGVGNLIGFGAEGLDRVGACTVFRTVGGLEDLVIGGAPPAALDAGAQLILNGPNANNLALTRDVNRHYSRTLAEAGIPGLPGSPASTPVIAPGAYTITGSGGADIGAFSATTTVAAPIQWNNRDSIGEVVRNQGVTVTWTGGGADTVVIVGASGTRVGGTETDPVFDAAVFQCVENARAGRFAVPASVLNQLPAATGDVLGGDSVGLLGLMQIGPANFGPFQAPLVAGGSIDFGSFTYQVGSMKVLAFR